MLDAFRNKPVIEAQERELVGLRADKIRLQADNDELRVALSKERDANTKLLNELRAAQMPREITPEVAARKLGIPVRILGQIDTERMGLQLPETKH